MRGVLMYSLYVFSVSLLDYVKVMEFESEAELDDFMHTRTPRSGDLDFSDYYVS